jgi:cell division protein FtsI (penicillin-binding protein 3)
MCVAFTAVVVRLGVVQGPSSRRFAMLGESQLVHDQVLPADRGSMFDRTGRDLALTMNVSTVWADPHQVADPRQEAEALAPVLGIDVDSLQQTLSANKGFVYLARKVSDDVAAKVKALNLPGVQLMDEPQRFLPNGDLAVPVLGRVGLDNEGLGGLESEYEKQLAGQPGRVLLERDLYGQDIPGGLRQFQPSRRGDDLVLTLDRSLQFQTEQSLSAQILATHARGGIAAVMQSDTGEILALANLARDDKDPEKVVPAPSNTALTNVFEPGSVNKLVTISGALEDGVVKPADRFTVGNSIKVSDATFHDDVVHPVAPYSVTDIVTNSSNIGTIMVAQKLGKVRLDHYLRAFGFGAKTDLGFPGESAGLLLPVDKWYGSSMGTIPIGQGVAVTAVQMLAAYNTIANGGVYVAPKLVKATVDAAGKEHPTAASERRRVVSQQTSDAMRAMLTEVVRLGTGKLAAIDGYTVAGKTGTARKPLENARGYKEGAYYATFAGFVPSEKPALTAIVVLDEPTPIYGGVVSAPVFAQVARYGLREFRVPAPPAGVRPAGVPAANPSLTEEGVDASAVPGANGTTPTTVPASAADAGTAPSSGTGSTSTSGSGSTSTTPSTRGATTATTASGSKPPSGGRASTTTTTTRKPTR